MSDNYTTTVNLEPAKTAPPPTATGSLETTAKGSTPAADFLLVCVADPFEAVGDSSNIVRVTVPTADATAAHLWTLEAVLDMNPPRSFKGWATHGDFTLDLSVNATVFPANSGTWGGTACAASGIGNCHVVVSRGPNSKVRFSADSGTRHATEQSMPGPEDQRSFNADIAFAIDGTDMVLAGAVAVISTRNWEHLAAGTGAAESGMFFDNKWHHNLDPADGYASVPGRWIFEVMTTEQYEAFCDLNGWLPYVLD